MGRIFWAGNINPAIESDKQTRIYHQTGQKTIADGGNQSGSFNGQPDKHAVDGLLLSQKKRKRFRQSDLRDGAETVDNNLCDAQEGVGLLVFGRSFV